MNYIYRCNLDKTEIYRYYSYDGGKSYYGQKYSHNDYHEEYRWHRPYGGFISIDDINKSNYTVSIDENTVDEIIKNLSVVEELLK